MEYKSKQYKINYQYYKNSSLDAYSNDEFFFSKSRLQDTYEVRGYSACDAINKLLDYCKKADRIDVYLLSCEEN